jgi:4-hydroxybenzoate polyprenyltransferase
LNVFTVLFIQMKKKIYTISNKLRVKEILLMTGFSFIGLIFAPYSAEDYKLLIPLSFFILLFVINIYFLNFYSDYNEDLRSNRLNNEIAFPRSFYLKNFFLTLVTLLALSVLLSYTLTTLYILIVFFWAMYYLPPLRLKSKFALGTLVHFIAGMLHFHIGYVVFDNISLHSTLISIFFALLLSIGHLNHEALDYDNDVKTGIKTMAVRIGLQRMYLLKLNLILLTFVYWFLIYSFSIIDGFQFYIFSVPLVIILILLKTRWYTAQTFQMISRVGFLIAGILYLIATTIL